MESGLDQSGEGRRRVVVALEGGRARGRPGGQRHNDRAKGEGRGASHRGGGRSEVGAGREGGR